MAWIGCDVNVCGSVVCLCVVTSTHTAHSEWNEEFQFREISLISLISAEVWDEDDTMAVGGPTFMGAFDVDMRAVARMVLDRKEKESWYDLTPRKDNKKDVVSGKVLVQFVLECHGVSRA